ncbi:exodeoxyribonuclease VII small subunit [Candidatus Poribacteria bacterium]|nr:exodeoxyribonuclease VII small subunit [Candidatus Poribacteria bacterium]
MPNDESHPPFEEALDELEAIVQRLERGETSLDEALKSFERGIQLVRQCAKTLDAMDLRVEQLLVSDDGVIRVEPFDAPDETTKE